MTNSVNTGDTPHYCTTGSLLGQSSSSRVSNAVDSKIIKTLKQNLSLENLQKFNSANKLEGLSPKEKKNLKKKNELLNNKIKSVIAKNSTKLQNRDSIKEFLLSQNTDKANAILGECLRLNIFNREGVNLETTIGDHLKSRLKRIESGDIKGKKLADSLGKCIEVAKIALSKNISIDGAITNKLIESSLRSKNYDHKAVKTITRNINLLIEVNQEQALSCVQKLIEASKKFPANKQVFIFQEVPDLLDKLNKAAKNEITKSSIRATASEYVLMNLKRTFIKSFPYEALGNAYKMLNSFKNTETEDAFRQVLAKNNTDKDRLSIGFDVYLKQKELKYGKDNKATTPRRRTNARIESSKSNYKKAKRQYEEASKGSYGYEQSPLRSRGASSLRSSARSSRNSMQPAYGSTSKVSKTGYEKLPLRPSRSGQGTSRSSTSSLTGKSADTYPGAAIKLAKKLYEEINAKRMELADERPPPYDVKVATSLNFIDDQSEISRKTKETTLIDLLTEFENYDSSDEKNELRFKMLGFLNEFNKNLLKELLVEMKGFGATALSLIENGSSGSNSGRTGGYPQGISNYDQRRF